MRKLVACIAVTGCLALGANALAGASDFGGKIEKGGKIGIDTDGGTDHVDRIRYEDFPTKCNGNPNFTFEATWVPGSDVPIVNKEFAIDTETMSGDKLHMTGRLVRGKTKIKGEIKATMFFDGGATKCVSRLRDYTATAGRDTTDLEPRASYKRVR